MVWLWDTVGWNDESGLWNELTKSPATDASSILFLS